MQENCYKRWSSDEDTLIKTNYQSQGPEWCAQALNRSKLSVYRRARVIGAALPREQWKLVEKELLPGEVHGLWTVLGRAKTEGGKPAYLCRCACGREKPVERYHLTSGKSSSCGCTTNRHVDIVGQVFGKLTVLERLVQPGRPVYSCRCACGKEVTVAKTSLRTGATRSCGCIKGLSVTKFDKAQNAVIRRYTDSRKLRGIECFLTKAEILEMTQQLCHYCGCKPSSRMKSHTTAPDFIYNGIDRVDSNKPYQLDNVVTACAMCNRAKFTESEADFMAWSKRVAQHQGWIGEVTA